MAMVKHKIRGTIKITCINMHDILQIILEWVYVKMTWASNLYFDFKLHDVKVKVKYIDLNIWGESLVKEEKDESLSKEKEWKPR